MSNTYHPAVTEYPWFSLVKQGSGTQVLRYSAEKTYRGFSSPEPKPYTAAVSRYKG